MVTASANSSVATFFAWWGQELRDLWPGGEGASQSAAAGTVLSVEADGLRLVEGPIARPGAPVGVVARDKMMAWLASLVRSGRSAPTVGLRLPASACFTRRVELPAVARRDFGRLLAMDLERTTPFRLKDVLTAYEADDAPSAKGLLKVRHLIVKRKAIEALKGEIEALGLRVTRIDCVNDNGAALPVNFLATASDVAAGPARASQAPKVLALAAVVLAASAAWLYVDRHEQAAASAAAETAKLKAKAQAQRDALAKTQTAFAEIASYQKLRSETVSKVLILEELTRILPDTAWVTDLKIDGATVDISGLAQSAAALVPLLERSKVFVDATSTASLVFDPREEKERFQIRARIRNGTAVAEAGKAAEAAK